MGLFTGLAIGALAAANVVQGLRKKKNSLATDQPLAPAPVEALAPPKPPTTLPGADEAAAQTAALKQRKRAAQGSLLTKPIAPKSNVKPMAPRLAPKSLIGYA